MAALHHSVRGLQLQSSAKSGRLACICWLRHQQVPIEAINTNYIDVHGLVKLPAQMSPPTAQAFAAGNYAMRQP